MYQAKRNGRNQIVFFKPDQSMEAELDARFIEEGRIRVALAENRFVLFAQPIWSFERARVEWFETLDLEALEALEASE